MSLELNCLVLGEDSSHIFAVEIDVRKKVSALKELLKDKKKHTFKDVDADALKIFKVSFPVDHELDVALERFRPEHDLANGVHHLSGAVKRLGGVFGEPTDEHLHVIVLPPPTGEHKSLWLFVSIPYRGYPSSFVS